MGVHKMYATKGIIQFTQTNYKDSNWTQKESDIEVVTNTKNTNFAYYMIYDPIGKSYRIGAFPLSTDTQAVMEQQLTWTYVNGATKEETRHISINKYPMTSFFIELHLTAGDYSYEIPRILTSIPVFRYGDTESLNKYVQNGDTSGAIKDVSTKWNLYIDGTKNPLYKLTWNCADIPKSDTSRVKVLFCASDDMINDTYIVKDTHYYEYNDKSVKLNYHDIREAVWGDAGGGVKSPVTIIVQFEYFETTTVVPKATSSYMYCELYPSETNGRMYGNIGFCKVGEHSTWFVKSDSGDSSTFTAHDGTDGSDGYTKDDDKGYNDNKDKDDDDDDTHVLSSGIGVLTSTFHMTKERLVQLGQFLWGSSICDEFSLINNNPIENIISCKAIPYAISGTTQEITLGNVKTGVNGEKISHNFSKQTIGSVAIAEHYKNFLDYAPYTIVII